MRKILSLLLIFFVGFSYAQELNCTVTVNADQVGGTNTQVYKTLQKSLTDFINKTDWTNQGFKNNERINCSMFINVSAVTGSTFTATLQVQSSRPGFNSTYSTPVFNFNDKEFNFDYTEFQNLNYNPNSFDSNLVSVVSYYCLMIIGMDADTFAPEGGTPYLETAQQIATVAQAGGYKGWSGSEGNSNRFFLVNDMLSPTYQPYRDAMYQYSFEGIDNMNRDQKGAKEKIKAAIATLSDIYKVRPNSFLMRVFFDAKSDELVSIFSGGPQVTVTDLADTLNRISPLNSAKWAGIKQ
ncbi:DUF4835 domain-containing protein [Flavobacterium noncentrifugens]|uniref:DUF4835 domain-containing protein n=1 Tax=Flavobacterium noncentrifugens TaxID=1128970 RepID=A0A1G8WCD2_9FLAO|nr:DUF4835 family protein [Flavobacterium noncentrifugens]GEP50862.1 DUF4835 domain-containing protein [Flavobacterium noncentrifugens]SDJ75884.1 protein of unknown function [Flavobacterium noncentrifugens]